jgi:hypothetical protein
MRVRWECAVFADQAGPLLLACGARASLIAQKWADQHATDQRARTSLIVGRKTGTRTLDSSIMSAVVSTMWLVVSTTCHGQPLQLAPRSITEHGLLPQNPAHECSTATHARLDRQDFAGHHAVFSRQCRRPGVRSVWGRALAARSRIATRPAQRRSGCRWWDEPAREPAAS